MITIGDNDKSILTIANTYWLPNVCQAGSYVLCLHCHYHIHSVSVKLTLLLSPLFYGEGTEVQRSSITW